MDRDPQPRKEAGSLDVFDEMASDSDTKPAPADDDRPAGTTIFESADAVNPQYDPGDANDVFVGSDDGLDLGEVDEVQASDPDPQLNLPGEQQDTDNEGEDPADDLDFNGPTEPVTISDDDPGDEIAYNGPDEPITFDEPVPSVPQSEGLEPIIAGDEANQAQPVGGDDDDPTGDQDSSPDLPWPTPPEPDDPQSPDLPSAFSQPEPPYELAVNLDYQSGYTLDLLDDEDDDLGDG